MIGSAEWAHLPGGVKALEFLAEARPQEQQKRYDKWVTHWMTFCRRGDGFQSYDPQVMTIKLAMLSQQPFLLRADSTVCARGARQSLCCAIAAAAADIASPLPSLSYGSCPGAC